MAASAGASTEDPARRFLVVEFFAHLPVGHYSVHFAAVADGLVAAGLPVETLTAHGWIGESSGQAFAFPVHRLTGWARRHWWLNRRLQRANRWPIGRYLLYLDTTWIVVREAQRLARARDCTDVVVTTYVDPFLASLLARRARWLLMQQFRPGTARRERPLRRWSRARVGRLPRPRVRVVANSETIEAAWAHDAPWTAPVHLPTQSRAAPPAPVPDARARLGVPESARVALAFGSHSGKDLETVFDAFADLPDWCLLVAGKSDVLTAPDRYRAWAAAQDPERARVPPVMVEGFVDLETMELLNSAADLVVISFQPYFEADSYTLLEAIAWGQTVVCSDGVDAARLTNRFRLGVVYPPGDAPALRVAVRGAPPRPDPDGLRAARAEFGPEAGIRRILAAHTDD